MNILASKVIKYLRTVNENYTNKSSKTIKVIKGLLTDAKGWKYPIYLDKGVNKMGHLHVVEYFPVLKRKKSLSDSAT
jgi:hypothetical protein